MPQIDPKQIAQDGANDGDVMTYSTTNGQWEPQAGGGGSGDVVGPGSAVDNAIARFDTTTGKLIQNSEIEIGDDTGNDSARIGAIAQAIYENRPQRSAATSTYTLVLDKQFINVRVETDITTLNITGPAQLPGSSNEASFGFVNFIQWTGAPHTIAFPANNWPQGDPPDELGDTIGQTDTFLWWYDGGGGSVFWFYLGNPLDPQSPIDRKAITPLLDGQISALTEKVSPVSGDHLLIEDSAAGNAKRRVQVGNLPAGTPGADSITNTELANMAQDTIKGRASGAGTGDPQDLTAAQATAILDVFTSALKGLVPASGGGTSNFLRADGTWAAPSGGGGGSIDSFQALKSGTQNTTTSFADITGWTEDINTGTAFTFNTTTGVLTFDEAGVYEINAAFGSFNDSTGNRCTLDLKIQVDTGGGFADMTGARQAVYAQRNATHDSGWITLNGFLYDASAGDEIKMQGLHIQTGITIPTNGARLSVKKIS